MRSRKICRLSKITGRNSSITLNKHTCATRYTKKVTANTHGYGASENHAHETDTQMMTADALQALVNVTMEYKEAMENLTIINLTLSQRLTQAQE